MDSELSPSVIGSYLNPPERMYLPSFTQNEASQNCRPVNSEVTSPKMFNSSNNQALVSALKTLQEKIYRLELERTQAEDNLNSLSREAAQYKKALENETNERNLAHQELIKQKKDISIQLSSAQSRCVLLEKQLEYTKRMVLNVEREKAMILEQQAQLQREKEEDQLKLHAKLAKLDVLEQECFRLTATQQTAEDKIKYLEEKLKEEEHQRKLFQDKACELQTGLEISKILMSTVSHSQHYKEKKKPPKKTKCLKREPPQQMDPRFRALFLEREKMVHPHGLYYLQKPVLVPEPQSLYKALRTSSQAKVLPLDSGEPVSTCDNLSELLMAMQEELDQMIVFCLVCITNLEASSVRKSYTRVIVLYPMLKYISTYTSERRDLGGRLAELMNCCCTPDCSFDSISPVPDMEPKKTVCCPVELFVLFSGGHQEFRLLFRLLNS